MSVRSLSRQLSRGLHHSRLLQIGLIVGFWLLGDALVKATGLPVTGGIAGLALVLVLLASRRLNLASMRLGANWLLAQMLLFFIPAVLAVLDHRELFGLLGLKVLAVILGSTLAVLGVTALVIDAVVKGRLAHDPAR
ncbi:CidA/LrgA family protein [Gallaecimonas xiamenensis]|uniref:LrgA family protein n=1 Tax=Gallaecimonas xiamenensis 3-C-1 TaxID=745411 RepID=K2KCC5_9GAMM|nr:CidA/LrgA family protein [Gallaecimonas xiamenensis]EKE74985.1 hypothetical protein B3C1_08856 [Gallaecimonas xiamenensis 3-C-1]